MKKSLPLGIQDYRKLKEGDYYAVDKTKMIEEFLHYKAEVTLITRPRRFGKTLNMSMIAEFFDITKDSRMLFQGTKIMKSACVSEMNQHPVIFLTFKDCKGKSMRMMQLSIYDSLLSEYQRYEPIIGSDIVDKSTSMICKRIISSLKEETDDFLTIRNAIKKLSQLLFEYYGRKVFLFIDEYDTPFNEAHTNGYYDEIHDVISSLFSTALKGNEYLNLALLTGIQRIAKENIFSGLNNLKVCTVIDHSYSSYFGFSEDETRELLTSYQLELNESVRAMYDGYHVGEKDIYNPWSIINYADSKELKPFWINTSSNSMIKEAMKSRSVVFFEKYEELIETGKTITFVDLSNSFYEERTDESLWGLLVNAGYATLNSQDEFGFSVLRIPNQEVKREFQKLTAAYLDVNDGVLMNLFHPLLTKDVLGFTQQYKEVLSILPSYHDTIQENSYHMMMLGMCAYLYSYYEIFSNRETGNGRCDIILKAKSAKYPHILMEFKYTKEDHEDLSKLAHKAVQQCFEKDYMIGYKGRIIVIGLAHQGKKCEIVYESFEQGE